MKLLQSMQWTKLNWDLSFQEKIRLAQILPKPFYTYNIELTWHEEYVDYGKVNLLWHPPHSELNGWVDRPSEILKSYVLTGMLKRSEIKKRSFSFQVYEVIPLVTLLESNLSPNSFGFPLCGLSDGSSYSLWEEAKNLCKANIGSYIYLYGYIPEILLEAIFKIESDGMYLLFHAYLPPAYYETDVLRYKLTSDEHRLFHHLLSIAQDISEEHVTLLSDDEIQGASYY